MATVVESKAPVAAKFDARVRAEIDRAAGRIRANDALAGAATLAVLTLAYATAGILLDRWLELPQWVRQIGFVGFLGTFGVVAYRSVVRPLRAVVNPRFAARKIESTSPGAKNAVINWVDLQDRDLPDAVRTAVSVKAADELDDADVHKATESRSLMRLATAAGVLFAVLAATLVLCKPTQFFSLLGRTFNPFTSARIASRTSITLTTPPGGDATVTAGNPFTVAASIAGRLPDPAEPDRVRLQYRHNPESTEYEDLPLTVSPENARQFTLQVPDYVVQNGFWYRIAAGDAATPEYRVTVRSRPLVKGYEARYEYPAYLRMQPDVGRDPALEAFRGTKVALTAKTNRQVKSGRLLLEGKPVSQVIGKPVGDGNEKDSLEFRLTLTEPGAYRLVFTSTADEVSEPTPAFPITILTDRSPTVEIASPKEPNITLPANGLLKVDGTVGDDFGIDSVTLRMKAIVNPGDVPVVLPPKKYQDRSFRRDADGSYPTSLEYKDSVTLGDLKDADGKPLGLKEKSVVEFWLEAADNCTEPKANVGKSRTIRVTLDKPVVEPAPKQQQKQDAAARKQEEQQARQAQDQRLDTEKREPPKQPHANADQPQNPDQKAGEKTEGEAQPGGTEKGGTDGKNGEQQPKAGGNDPAPKDQGTPPANPQAPTKEPGNGADANGEKTPNKPDDRDLQDKANKVQDALKQQERQPGQARDGDQGKAEDPPAPAADKKPGGQPPMDGASEPKAGEKPEDKQPGAAAEPKAGGQSGDSKGPGQVEPPPMPADAKPDAPKPEAGPGSQEQQPTGNTPKTEPQKGENDAAGGEKKSDTKPEPKAGGGQKPAAGEGRGKPGDAEKSQPGGGKQQPKPAGQSKPKADADRGEENPAPPPSPDAAQEPDGPKPADAKRDKPTPGGKSKPKPAEGNDAGGKPSPSDEKPSADGQQPSADKPEGNDANPDHTQTPPQKGQPGQGAAGQPGEEKSSEDQSPGELEPGELDRMLERGGKKIPPPKETVERLTRKSNDLASGDQQKRQDAEKEFDDLLGKKDREKLQQAAKDQQQGNDPAKQDAAKKDADELTKKAGQKEQDKERARELAKQADDLSSNDEQTRKNAEEKFDEAVGKENRQKLQDAMNDLKSGDPKRQQAGRDKIKDLAKQAGQGGGDQGDQPSPEELAQAAKDLNSPDDAKRKAAEKKLDEQIGKQAREDIQQAAKDLNSKDEGKRKAAEDKLRDMAQQAGGQPNAGEKQPSREDVEQAKKDAEGLASDDEKTRKAAEEKFDKQLGEQKRKELQQAMKDQKAGTPEQQKAAKDKADDLAKQAAAGKQPDDKNPAGGGQPSPKEAAEKMANDAKDLASKDPAKRKAAEEKFDKMMGKDKREQLQKDAADLQSGDPDKQKAAAERMQKELANQAGKPDADPQADRTAKEQADKLADKAKDLASDDKNKREAAEKEFDDKIGKDKREQLQQAMKDMASDDPKKAEEGQRKLEEMAKEAMKNQRQNPNDRASDDPNPNFRPGGGGGKGAEAPPIDGDPKNRLKTAELQLVDLEKNRYNDELKKKLGFTDEEYNRFLDSYRQMVERLRTEADDTARKPDATPRPAGPPALRVGESGNAGFTADATANTNAAAGAAAAPPGFTDAQRKFAEAAAKRGQQK